MHRSPSDGAPSLHLPAAAACKLLEANPVTKLAFSNSKNRRVQTAAYSQAHAPTKYPVRILGVFFKENVKYTGWENGYTLNKEVNFYPEVKLHWLITKQMTFPTNNFHWLFLHLWTANQPQGSGLLRLWVAWLLVKPRVPLEIHSGIWTFWQTEHRGFFSLIPWSWNGRRTLWEHPTDRMQSHKISSTSESGPNSLYHPESKQERLWQGWASQVAQDYLFIKVSVTIPALFLCTRIRAVISRHSYPGQFTLNTCGCMSTCVPCITIVRRNWVIPSTAALSYFNFVLLHAGALKVVWCFMIGM